MHGSGNRHSPSAHIRRADASGSTANLKSAPLPPGRTHPAPIPDSTDTSSGGVLHFFSIPHWTRRLLPVSSARKSLAGSLHSDGHNVNLPTTPPRRLLLEKDLPPTPLPQADIASHEPSTCLNDARVSISVQQVTDTPLQPSFYLDVYHNTPMISSPSQINSVAFASSPNSSTENVLRKSKSTHSLRLKQPSSCLEQQRARGVSMAPMFTKANRASTSPCTTDGNSSSTPLVRKSSFWRKFSTPSAQHLTVHADSPSLPALKPASPLRVDFTTSPGSIARSRSSSSGAGPSRRLSECVIRQPSAGRTNYPSLPHGPATPDRTDVRPSTADPYVLASHCSPMRRPATADSANPFRSRSRSFFALSQKPATPHSNNETPSDNTTQQLKSGPPNPRPRSSTNPPLLHRLSVNLFASSSSSAAKNGVTSSPSSRSPRPSLSQIPSDVLKPQVGEASEAFVNRLVSLLSKADIAVVLASSGESIYTDSLKLFMERFGFHGEPLDVALRRLLMDVGLPRETQQIDRVIEAFANRYLSCNPDLFTSRDHPYILAFSLIMLHTDAFNKSNKRKMSKGDYIRNTTLPGLIPEVLDCFYDNTVFAPFIFIEDPLDPEGSVEGTRPSTSSGLPSPMIQSGNALLSRPKIDPYYLITNNLLGQLHVNVDSQISPENPFRWDGTGTSWNYDEILLAFTRGHVVQIGSTDLRSTAPFFGMSIGGVASPSVHGLGSAPETPLASETWSIKLTKVAVLNRKDDLLEGGKKPLNRKWRPCSVALTKSQLLLFRDLSWSSTLLSWNNTPKKSPISSMSFKPDEIIPLRDAVAVLDQSYSKHLNTFRLTTRDGRHVLFQTTEEKEMNEWISRINYASTFKTTGVRMRSLGMTGKALELAGVAAATSHLHDLRLPNFGQPRVLTWDHRNHSELGEARGNDRLRDGHPVGTYRRQSELAELSAPEVEGASQFKETFDTVKAELAAARISAGDPPVAVKACSAGTEPPHLVARSHMIHTRVEELENRICATNAQINSSMHVARNIAILAPFQKSTRDRLQDAIQTMSKKIQTMRLDVTKLICHRNILLNDLAVEERNFKRATSVALQAATETLQQRYSEYTSQLSSSTQRPLPKSSFHEETSTGSQSFDSSTYEPFHSALDFGPDWPSSGEAFGPPSFLGPTLAADSPVTPAFDSLTSYYPSPDETSYFSLSTNQAVPESSLHENTSVVPDFPEEQAEDWNKTRAAKRVSLVKLPSDLRMSAIAGISSRHLEENSLLKEESKAVGDVTYRT